LIDNDHQVIVLDNLLTGNMKNLSQVIDSPMLTFIKSGIEETDTLLYYGKGCETLIHLAANPDVKAGYHDTSIDFNLNISNTKTVLDALKKIPEMRAIVFASTSTVYGEPKVIPTPESYGPLLPISLYGGSKLACEALISAYCSLFKKKGFIFRLANVVGSHSNHGVIYDFIKKLRRRPQSLEILGDGTQRKSYIHVSDCIDAFLTALTNSDSNASHSTSIFNVGSKDYINVIDIARIIIEQSNASTATKLLFDNSIENGRGWNGDVKEMLLDTSKIRAAGWQPRFDSSAEAVRKAAEEVLVENQFH
jgi:UDP-glucose 4-epimerase